MALPLRIIDPVGDVVLNLPKVRLLVSSKVLALNSRPFHAMFGPHFREGQSLNTATPTEISLLDDDSDGMELLCNVLHLRSDVLDSGDISLELLVPFSIMCDKYDCSSAVAYHSRAWLGADVIKPTVWNVQKLLEVAIVLRNEAAFANASKFLILNRYEALETFVMDEWNSVLSASYCGKSSQRSQQRGSGGSQNAATRTGIVRRAGGLLTFQTSSNLAEAISSSSSSRGSRRQS